MSNLSDTKPWDFTVLYLLNISLCIILAYLCRSWWFDNPSWYDIYLYLPLVRSWAMNLPIESSQDLLLQGGNQAPFYLYRIFAWLLQHGISEATLLETAFFIGFFLYGIAAFLIGGFAPRNFSQSFDKLNGLLTLLLALFLPGSFLTLNWHIIPISAPVSALFGYPLCLLQIIFALSGMSFISYLCAGVNAVIHPSYSLIGAVVSTAIFINEFLTSRNYKKIGATLIYTICLYFIIRIDTHNTLLQSATNSSNYFQYSKIFAHHLSPLAHIRDGWGIGYLILISSLLILRTVVARQWYEKYLLITVITCGLGLLSLVNTFFELSMMVNIAVFSRALSLIEPFAISIFSYVFIKALSARHYSLCIGIVLIIFGSCLSGETQNIYTDRDQGFIVIAGVAFLLNSFFSRKVINRSIFLALSIILSILPLTIFSEMQWFEYGYSLLLIMYATLLYGFSLYYNPISIQDKLEDSLQREVIVGLKTYILCFLLLSGTIIFCWPKAGMFTRMHPKCSPELHDAYDWIDLNTDREALFILNPGWLKKTTEFRVCANRNLFSAIADINQLMYSPNYYETSILRAKQLGMKINDFNRNMYYSNLSFEGYEDRILRLNKGALSKKDDVYVITLSKVQLPNQIPVFQNSSIAIYRMASSVLSQIQGSK